VASWTRLVRPHRSGGVAELVGLKPAAAVGKGVAHGYIGPMARTAALRARWGVPESDAGPPSQV